VRILYATDGRAPATAAGSLLARLAAPELAKITILHAAEYGNPVVAARYANRVVEEAEAAITQAGLAAEVVMTQVGPVASIERELAAGDYALTVVGAGNHPWFDRLVFGSVSTYLLHEARTPVLVVHRGPNPDHERLRVLVGTDGSAPASAAVDALLGVTTPALAEVHVISVAEPTVFPMWVHPGGVDLDPLGRQLRERRLADARANVDEVLERLRRGGFTPEGTIAQGPPAPEILAYVDGFDADLVVVGARGRGTIARLAVGSVSGHLARTAPATLVSRAPEGGGEVFGS
jgi:nucleotide-binding universal stress UspA family protein